MLVVRSTVVTAVPCVVGFAWKTNDLDRPCDGLVGLES